MRPCGHAGSQCLPIDVADVAFWSCVERATLCNDTFRAQHGIEFYARFRDDGLIITSGGPANNAVSMFNGMKQHSRYFCITDESTTRESIDCVNAALFKGGRWQHPGILDSAIVDNDRLCHSGRSIHRQNVHGRHPPGVAPCGNLLELYHLSLNTQS